MFNKIVLPFCILLLPVLLNAQNQEDCGTEITATDLQIIHQALGQSLSYKDRTPVDSTVPIKFHIIANDNGVGGIDSASVFNELALANSMYINAGIKFIHCGEIDYINQSLYMNFEKSVSETICDMNDLPNVLNVYFAPNVFKISNGNTEQLCGYAYTSSLTKNRVIMDNSCSTNGSTLLHEIGHYFSLAHTHSTSSGDELANGSNCGTAGDELCDTPADPGLSTLVVSSACAYTGTFTDQNNQVYTPNVRNIMSYSRKSCRDEFSLGQYQRMQAYFQTYRNYLSCAPLTTSDISAKQNLKVYPNPSNGLVQFKSAQLIQNIILFDQTGRIVSELNASNNTVVQMDLIQLVSGVYYYQIYTKDGIANGKILKQ